MLSKFYHRFFIRPFTPQDGPLTYDLTIAEDVLLGSGGFQNVLTLEEIELPDDVYGHVTGRSTYARKGLLVEGACIIQPGFRGRIAMELSSRDGTIHLPAGSKPFQICFGKVEGPQQEKTTYISRYQDQQLPGPVDKADD
jgi:deoxycytidine triphosphate deaminase